MNTEDDYPVKVRSLLSYHSDSCWSRQVSGVSPFSKCEEWLCWFIGFWNRLYIRVLLIVRFSVTLWATISVAIWSILITWMIVWNERGMVTHQIATLPRPRRIYLSLVLPVRECRSLVGALPPTGTSRRRTYVHAYWILTLQYEKIELTLVLFVMRGLAYNLPKTESIMNVLNGGLHRVTTEV